MEYRPVTDPLNPEYYHLFVKPKPWEEGIRLLSLDDSKTDPLIDPVKNPILTRVIMWSFGLAVVSIILIGFASPPM